MNAVAGKKKGPPPADHSARLLKLAPDAERLRRIAKAYAAGELSQTEYRRIRGQVIERFGDGNAGGRVDFGDDTERRASEPTQPLALTEGEPLPSAAHRRTGSRRTGSRRTRIGAAIVMGLLLLGWAAVELWPWL